MAKTERNLRIAKLFVAGTTINQIAIDENLSEQSVHRILVHAGEIEPERDRRIRMVPDAWILCCNFRYPHIDPKFSFWKREDDARAAAEEMPCDAGCTCAHHLVHRFNGHFRVEKVGTVAHYIARLEELGGARHRTLFEVRRSECPPRRQPRHWRPDIVAALKAISPRDITRVELANKLGLPSHAASILSVPLRKLREAGVIVRTDFGRYRINQVTPADSPAATPTTATAVPTTPAPGKLPTVDFGRPPPCSWVKKTRRKKKRG